MKHSQNDICTWKLRIRDRILWLCKCRPTPSKLIYRGHNGLTSSCSMWTEVVLAWIKLYTGLFSLRVIFALLHLQSASSYLQFAHTQLWQKRYYLWQWNLPSLKFALNNEGEKGENKTGVNISLNTVADFLESNFLASSMMYGQYIWKKKCMHILQINLFFLFFLIPVSAIT